MTDYSAEFDLQPTLCRCGQPVAHVGFTLCAACAKTLKRKRRKVRKDGEG